MKTLYVVNNEGKQKVTIELLQNACASLNVHFQEIIVEQYDFSTPILLSAEDGLYNVSDFHDACMLEKTLINAEVNTLYSETNACYTKTVDADDVTTYLLLRERGLPVVETVLFIPSRKSIASAADLLGGFPLIMKAGGGAHGVGVMYIDSMKALLSTADYLRKMNSECIVRKFVGNATHGRFIVLGNSVVDSIEYRAPENDFRTNVGSNPTVMSKQFDNAVNRIAVDAVHALGYEFGGVDILIDDSGKPHILEVNFPCYFARAQQCSNIDIAEMMVQYLMNKSQRPL